MKFRYGYNVCNTLVYSLLLIFCVYLVYVVLKKLKVKIDWKLALAIFPYVILGSSTRVLEDVNLLTGFWFISPGIWVLFFCICFSVLIICIYLQRKLGVEYYKLMVILGCILAAVPLGLLPYRNISRSLDVLIFYSIWAFVIYIIKWSLENKIVLGIHMFDASTTFIAVSFYGFFEQHVLPRFLISITGPISFVILKFVIVGMALLLIDKYSRDREFNNFLKLCIGILGGATATRDFLRLII
jgi:uncharacterized membrane protein